MLGLASRLRDGPGYLALEVLILSRREREKEGMREVRRGKGLVVFY